MVRARKSRSDEAFDKLGKGNEVSKEVSTGDTEIEWLAQIGFPKRHAVSKGGSISLCGRGGDRSWRNDPLDLPKCKKCLFLVKYKGTKRR
jgi:hypothetical protein